MAYLLDTNVWINYLKDAASPIRAKLATVTPADIVLCSGIGSRKLAEQGMSELDSTSCSALTG